MKAIKDLSIKSRDALEKMDSQALKTELTSSQKALYTMNMKLALGEIKQTHLIKFLRRYVAGLHTLINLKR